MSQTNIGSPSRFLIIVSHDLCVRVESRLLISVLYSHFGVPIGVSEVILFDPRIGTNICPLIVTFPLSEDVSIILMVVVLGDVFISNRAAETSCIFVLQSLSKFCLPSLPRT